MIVVSESEIEIKAIEKVVEKLDASIDKLTEVSNNISKLLAVHDTRLDMIEKDTTRVEDDIRDIHEKMNKIAADLSDKLDEAMKASNAGHEKIQQVFETRVLHVDKRVKELETWRWFVVGAAAVVAWIINKVIGKF